MPKRIDKLTPEQEARMPEWRDKWIAIGLQTDEADWETFEKAVKVAYNKANLSPPKTIVRVQSPIVGAFAAPIASKLINDLAKKRDGAVGGAVRGAVGGAVRGAVDGAVRGAVDDGWYNYLGGQFWVGGWYWGSPSYISFMTEVAGLETTIDIQERAKSYQDIAKSVCWWWPYTNFVMVCNRPSMINRDEQGRLHSETEQAIQWPDGWGFHALRGERFDGPGEVELWKRITSGNFTAKEMMAIEDSDKRSIAMTYLRPEDMIEQMHMKHVHTGIKGNKLYECKDYLGSGKTEYALWMKDASTPREFIHFVPKDFDHHNNADEATAGTYRTGDGRLLPLEDYLLIGADWEA